MAGAANQITSNQQFQQTAPTACSGRVGILRGRCCTGRLAPEVEKGVSVRWTKRPQNVCRSCGYSWYPRGKNVSAQCPRCGSPEVELAIEALLRAVGYLIAAPFILL